MPSKLLNWTVQLLQEETNLSHYLILSWSITAISLPSMYLQCTIYVVLFILYVNIFHGQEAVGVCNQSSLPRVWHSTDKLIPSTHGFYCGWALRSVKALCVFVVTNGNTVFTKNPRRKAAEVAQCSLLFQRTAFTVCNSSFRESDTFLWPPQAPKYTHPYT